MRWKNTIKMLNKSSMKKDQTNVLIVAEPSCQIDYQSILEAVTRPTEQQITASLQKMVVSEAVEEQEEEAPQEEATSDHLKRPS